MQKGNQCSIGSDPWFLINKLDAFILEFVEFSLDIVDAQTNVMQTGATLGNKFANRSVGAKRFEKLYVRIADFQFCHTDALFLDGFNRYAGQSECIFVEAQRLFKI